MKLPCFTSSWSVHGTGGKIANSIKREGASIIKLSCYPPYSSTVITNTNTNMNRNNYKKKSQGFPYNSGRKQNICTEEKIILSPRILEWNVSKLANSKIFLLEFLKILTKIAQFAVYNKYPGNDQYRHKILSHKLHQDYKLQRITFWLYKFQHIENWELGKFPFNNGQQCHLWCKIIAFSMLLAASPFFLLARTIQKIFLCPRMTPKYKRLFSFLFSKHSWF